MTTQVRRIANTLGATPLGALDLTDNDIALVALTALTEWWRADQGLGGVGVWKGRKADTLLTPRQTSDPLPVKQTGGANGKPFVLGATTELLAPVGSTLLPIAGSFTLAWIGRLSAGQTGGAVFGSYDANTKLWAGYSGVDPNQALILNSRGTTIDSVAGPYPYSAGVKLVVVSYKWIASNSQRVGIRVNGATLHDNTADKSTWAVADQRLAMFATNTTRATPFNGEIYDAFVFNGTALLDGAHATELAALEAYASARYAIF